MGATPARIYLPRKAREGRFNISGDLALPYLPTLVHALV
jgi:hypothetical protein